MTGVLVVEDQQVLAAALEIAIGTQPDLDCVGTAATVEDALATVAERRPDVVLMDIQLPGTDGIEGTRRIKAAYPDVNILILTAGATAGRLAAAAAAGAGGFLAKNGPFSDILAAIRNPMQSKMVVEGTTLTELIKHIPGPPGLVPSQARPAQVAAGQPRPDAGQAPEAARLTAREQEVLALMGEGLDPSAIAERLVLSVYTARGHVKNVMMKLGAHTQLEAVVIATKSGLLPPRGAALGG
ncbi:MAG TPA: response regulator transcription factor [Streptosporangiaceae bacterium]